MAIQMETAVFSRLYTRKKLTTDAQLPAFRSSGVQLPVTMIRIENGASANQ